MLLNRPVQTRFRCGFGAEHLSLATYKQLASSLCKRHAVIRHRRTPTDCKHTVSGTISLSSQEYFSPFPHGTGSLSVTREYLALGDGPPGFKQDFTCPALLGSSVRKDRSFSPTGLSPAMVGLSRTIRLTNDFITFRILCIKSKLNPATPVLQRMQALT